MSIKTTETWIKELALRACDPNFEHPIVVLNCDNQAYEHVNAAFFTTFGLTVHDLNNRQFEELWRISRNIIVKTVSDAVKRTGQPQLFGATTWNQKTNLFEHRNRLAFHFMNGTAEYRTTIFFQPSSDAKFELKII